MLHQLFRPGLDRLASCRSPGCRWLSTPGAISLAALELTPGRELALSLGSVYVELGVARGV